MRELEGIILTWLKKELKAQGFRVSAPDEGTLRVRFPKKQNQVSAAVRIRIDSDEVVISTRLYPQVSGSQFGTSMVVFPAVPLSRPDCLKQVVCYLHQCRVHFAKGGTCGRRARRV